MAGALIVTAELGEADFAWLDQLRRTHFPVERNRVAAHLTIFHAIPPSAEMELRRRLSELARSRPPRATLEGIMNLGNGVAFRVFSEDLDRIRTELASELHGLLTAQDAGGWVPHVTIQNKVPAKVSNALAAALESQFRPRALSITGLGLHRYEDGPWKQLNVYPFRGA